MLNESIIIYCIEKISDVVFKIKGYTFVFREMRDIYKIQITNSKILEKRNKKLSKDPLKSKISYFFMIIVFFGDLLPFFYNIDNIRQNPAKSSKNPVQIIVRNSPFHRSNSARWRKWKVLKILKLFF